MFEALRAALPDRLQPRIAELRARPSHTADEAQLVSQWIGKYTEGYQAKESAEASDSSEGSGPGVSLSTLDLVRALLGSPDYRLRDVAAACLTNGCMKDKRLFGEILDLDLSDTLAAVRVPYLIILGEKDIVTSTRAIRAFLEEKINEHLSFYLVNGAGHVPGIRALDELFEHLDTFTGVRR